MSAARSVQAHTPCVWEDCDQEAVYCHGHAREFIDPLGKLKSHSALVAVLREIVDAYTARFGRGANYVGPVDDEIKAASAALAAAEGKA
jgi:hypothetical protein